MGAKAESMQAGRNLDVSRQIGDWEAMTARRTICICAIIITG
jgi:hypothetical protein